MSRSALTGSRIRERRMLLGIRQTDLARQIGVSPSYLNLIEHNRRRIAPPLVDAAAAALGVEAAALTEGVEAALLEQLRDAAAQAGTDAMPDHDRIEELVGRFPGWAELVAAQNRRIAALERTVERLTDRMAHDPYLPAALHEVLSAATALRSTAAILVETDNIPPDWLRKFHRNLHEDSMRLAEGAQALVGYLDASFDEESGLAAPQEELEAWLAERGHFIAEMEGARAPAPEAVIEGVAELASTSARALARRWLERYRADAAALPMRTLQAALAEAPDLLPDPGAIAERFGVPLPLVFRRLASMPGSDAGSDSGTEHAAPAAPVGLVVCDASGTLIFRKPVEGFALPRFGAACPLWPLYQALARPMHPIRALVEMGVRLPSRFLTYSVCEPVKPPGFEHPPVFQAHMLILPAPPSVEQQGMTGPEPIGTACRICERTGCPARREPSILAEGF